MLPENFQEEENILNEMKILCRKNFGNFLSLVIILLKCLVALGEEHRDLILYIWHVNINIIL